MDLKKRADIYEVHLRDQREARIAEAAHRRYGTHEPEITIGEHTTTTAPQTDATGRCHNCQHMCFASATACWYCAAPDPVRPT